MGMKHTKFALCLLSLARLSCGTGSIVGNWSLVISCTHGSSADGCFSLANMTTGAMEIKADGSGSLLWNNVAAFMFQDSEFDDHSKDHIDATLYAMPGSAAITSMHLKTTTYGFAG